MRLANSVVNLLAVFKVSDIFEVGTPMIYRVHF